MKDFLKILSVIVICLFAGAYLHKCQSPAGFIEGRTEFVTDTLKVTDTIPYYAPKPQTELVTGTRRYTLPTYYFIGGGAGGVARSCSTTDTICCVDSIGISSDYGTGAGGEPRRCYGDSAVVELPIIRRHYSDSTYEAWVSGPIDPRLDSLRVFALTTIITKREWKPPKRWHIGPTIGYGLTPHGFRPYIGVSITYSIISW